MAERDVSDDDDEVPRDKKEEKDKEKEKITALSVTEFDPGWADVSLESHSSIVVQSHRISFNK
jgi:hypothetical protein